MRRDAPDHWARSTQNIVHWATGMGWSAQFGVIAGTANRPSWVGGLVLGPLVWLSGYVVLPLTKIYKPIWDYDAETLAKDLSAHLVYSDYRRCIRRDDPDRPAPPNRLDLQELGNSTGATTTPRRDVSMNENKGEEPLREVD